MSRRITGAWLGLLAAALASFYVIHGVIEAARPVPTSVRLVNATMVGVQVDRVVLGEGHVVAEKASLPAAPGASAPLPSFVSREIALAPGLKVDVAARLGEPPTTAWCTLEPRPQGACVVRAEFSGTAQLRCEYECLAVAPAP